MAYATITLSAMFKDIAIVVKLANCSLFISKAIKIKHDINTARKIVADINPYKIELEIDISAKYK